MTGAYEMTDEAAAEFFDACLVGTKVEGYPFIQAFGHPSLDGRVKTVHLCIWIFEGSDIGKPDITD